MVAFLVATLLSQEYSSIRSTLCLRNIASWGRIGRARRPWGAFLRGPALTDASMRRETSRSGARTGRIRAIRRMRRPQIRRGRRPANAACFGASLGATILRTSAAAASATTSSFRTIGTTTSGFAVWFVRTVSLYPLALLVFLLSRIDLE